MGVLRAYKPSAIFVNWVNKLEIFDAVDDQGNLLGYDLIRGQKIPKGVYHKVIQVFTFNQNNQLLITLRHPDKVFGLLWEVTAGSVLKGEDERSGAVRELEEETGLIVAPDDLKRLYTLLEGDSLWYTYWVKTNVTSADIRYQAKETIDHQWIDGESFMRLFNTGQFPQPMNLRMKQHWDYLKQTLKEAVDFDII